MRKTFWFALLLVVVHAGLALAAPPQVKPSYDLRLRYEAFDTPQRNPATDPEYHLWLARFRAGLDVAWTKWKLHGMLQAGGVLDIPENGAFAAGPTYFSANQGRTDVGVLGLAELYGAYEAGGWKLVLGRQPYADGFEVPTGLAQLDAVERRRLSDRLVGTFEWPNTARRFDGVSLGYGPGSTHVAVFGLRPLGGAFESYNEAFEEIDDVTVYGATVTGRHGAWIPGTEVRLFTVQYEDDRPVAPGGNVSVNTSGASLLVGNASSDLLLWGALQTGEWGRSDQDAWAFLVDVGRRFDGVPGKPDVHLAWEQSSGDPDPRDADHETFFNVLPTNHKFYGSMDYLAFQNLRDAYAEALFGVGPKLKVRTALHDFALTETADAWYGGSGAFEEGTFGYAARSIGRPYPSKELGRELDLELTWPLRSGFELGVGGGRWWSGAAAEAFFPLEQQGSWGYLQLGWKR
jgi:hypothetical protein